MVAVSKLVKNGEIRKIGRRVYSWGSQGDKGTDCNVITGIPWHILVMTKMAWGNMGIHWMGKSGRKPSLWESKSNKELIWVKSLGSQKISCLWLRSPWEIKRKIAKSVRMPGNHVHEVVKATKKIFSVVSQGFHDIWSWPRWPEEMIFIRAAENPAREKVEATKELIWMKSLGS